MPWLFLMLLYFAEGKSLDEVQLKHHLQGQLQGRLLAENLLKSAPHAFCPDFPPLFEERSPYLFISFSLEEPLWIQYSRELEKIGGCFVVRGLPQNSFKKLSEILLHFQKIGVKAPILIHPALFAHCEIQRVPTIAILEGNRFDKISGNLSLKSALEKLATQGETSLAKKLHQKYLEMP